MLGKNSRAMAAVILMVLPGIGNAFEWLYSDVAPANTPQQEIQDYSATDVIIADHGACISAIKKAEARHGIPENLLLAIGLQEAGLKRDGILTIWPWTINSKGVGSRFDSKNDAVSYSKSLQIDGLRSFDVGCMQINMRWHGQHFSSLDDAYDPDQNADYAARFLKALRLESDSWLDAAGNYHSKTPKHHKRYLSGIERNLKVAAAKSDEFQALSAQHSSKAISISQVSDERKKTTVEVQGFRNSFISENTIQNARSRQQHRVDQKNTYAQRKAALHNDVQIDEHESPAQLTGAWWTSELSKSHSKNEKRTIYSTQSIEPVLPNLRDMTR